MPNPYGYGDVLAAEVERGAVDVRHVDRCVWRVLRAKFEVGLFEHPYPTERIDVAAAAQEGSELSQELARRSIVLAKNDGILPLYADGAGHRRHRPACGRAIAAVPDLHLRLLARGQRGYRPGRARHHERCRRRGDRLVRSHLQRAGRTQSGPGPVRRTLARGRGRGTARTRFVSSPDALSPGIWATRRSSEP